MTDDDLRTLIRNLQIFVADAFAHLEAQLDRLEARLDNLEGR